MHIMLFGGAFDPVHNGHLEIAQEIVEQKIADVIWFIPCAQHPFGKKMTAKEDRLAMLQLVEGVTINTFEIDQPTTSYTIETIEHFAKLQPTNTFSWLIGSDQLPSFTRWHRWQELVNDFTVFVYPRQDFPFDQLQAGMVALKQLPLVTISSTMIRDFVREHKSIEQFVPGAVGQYISTNHLYE
jgi:nicotinate-nucleotide adenylyltransferase